MTSRHLAVLLGHVCSHCGYQSFDASESESGIVPWHTVAALTPSPHVGCHRHAVDRVGTGVCGRAACEHHAQAVQAGKGKFSVAVYCCLFPPFAQ